MVVTKILTTKQKNKRRPKIAPAIALRLLKLDMEQTMSELGKPFLKKTDQKNFEKKQKINVKEPNVKKPYTRNENLIHTKN